MKGGFTLLFTLIHEILTESPEIQCSKINKLKGKVLQLPLAALPAQVLWV